MTILNHYEKASEILHSVIHKEPLTPTVYAIVPQGYVKYRKIHITPCNTITIYVIHCVCQTNKSHKTADENMSIGLIQSGIYAENKTNIMHNVFFQPVKSLMKVKELLYPNNRNYWFGKHGTCAHKCLLDREFSLPMTHLIGGAPLSMWKG